MVSGCCVQPNDRNKTVYPYSIKKKFVHLFIMKTDSYTNAIYSISCYGLSYFLNRYIGKPYPCAVSVELTNNCNLHCPECATGSGIITRPRGLMDLTLAEKIAEELKHSLLSANLYFQGEPMLHPCFFELVDLFRGLNSTISTNGHFLDGERCKMLALSGLGKIIVSLDGITQPVYSTYRMGGNLELVIEGVRNLSEALKRVSNSPDLELLFLYGKHNAHELEDVKSFARSLGVSFKVKSMEVLNPGDAEQWIPESGEKTRYEIKGGTYDLKKRPVRGCFRVWTTPVITWDGNMLPCCFDKDAVNSFGNISEQPFESIWNGAKRKEFIAELIRTRAFCSICSKCPQGLKLFY